MELTPTRPPGSSIAFSLLAKPTGAICNLRCDYCFFLAKEELYPGSRFRMPDEVLESYISQLIGSQSVPEVTVAWQGGEPALMGLDFFRRSLELEEKYRPPGMRILNSIQSPWLGGLMDTGNFLEDPYTKLAMIAPKTIYVQAKTYYGGGEWYTLDLDYKRIAAILANVKYQGYVSLEYEGKEAADSAVAKSLAVLRKAFPLS